MQIFKKGAIRIGFTALEDLNWSVQIQVQGLGINYTNPGVLRSDVLIAAAEPIVLDAYKEAYLENPGKVITDLNRELENRMQQQITHVQRDENVRLHEQIMSLTLNGMHVTCFNSTLSLKDRWLYSQNLAVKLNSFADKDATLLELNEQITSYETELQKKGLTEAELFWFAIGKKWRLKTLAKMLLQLPFFLAGLIQVALPYFAVKRFVEQKFKRKVFWSSTKMGLLLLALPIWNFALLFLASCFIELAWWYWILYFLSLHFVALGFYLFLQNSTLLMKSLRYNAQSMQSFVVTRGQLLGKLKTLQF